jgi:hypothetical protein
MRMGRKSVEHLLRSKAHSEMDALGRKLAGGRLSMKAVRLHSDGGHK